MKYTILLFSLFVAACGDGYCEGEWDSHEVRSVMSCTGPQHGYGGNLGECRVELDNGAKATVRAPTAPGDLYESKGTCIWIKGSPYAPLYAGNLWGN
jgi:hypothetical protein